MALKDITITRNGVERSGTITDIRINVEAQNVTFVIVSEVDGVIQTRQDKARLSLSINELTTSKQPFIDAINAAKADLVAKYGD